MDATAQQLLDIFAQTVDRMTLTSEDWGSFYDFTIHIHMQHLSIEPWEVRDRLLTAHGFSLQKASWMSTEHRRFLEILTRYDKTRFRNLYDRP